MSAQPQPACQPTAAPPLALLRRRATAAVCLLGGIEVLLFGFVALAVWQAARVPLEQLQQRMAGGPLSGDQLASIHPHLPPFALMLAAAGVLPGVAYLLCGIGIRQGRTAAATVAAVLALTQLFVLAMVFLQRFLAALATGEPPVVTINVLVIGTPMALLMYVTRCLWQWRAAAGRLPARPPAAAPPPGPRHLPDSTPMAERRRN